MLSGIVGGVIVAIIVGACTGLCRCSRYCAKLVTNWYLQVVWEFTSDETKSCVNGLAEEYRRIDKVVHYLSASGSAGPATDPEPLMVKAKADFRSAWSYVGTAVKGRRFATTAMGRVLRLVGAVVPGYAVVVTTFQVGMDPTVAGFAGYSIGLQILFWPMAAAVLLSIAVGSFAAGTANARWGRVTWPMIAVVIPGMIHYPVPDRVALHATVAFYIAWGIAVVAALIVACTGPDRRVHWKAYRALSAGLLLPLIAGCVCVFFYDLNTWNRVFIASCAMVFTVTLAVTFARASRRLGRCQAA